MPLPTTDFDPRALRAAAPGTAEFQTLLARLTSHLHAEAINAAERAVSDVIARLVDAGFAFAADERLGGLAFRAPLPDGEAIAVEVLIGGGTSVDHLTAARIAELEAEQGPSPEETLFYERLDAARARARAGGLGALDRDDRVVYAAGEAEAHVQHGGFEHYFLHTPAAEVAAATRALKSLGATAAAGLLAEALAALPGGRLPDDDAAREHLIAGLGARARRRLETLATRWYARAEPIAALGGALLSRAPGPTRRTRR